jgi:hypothetical protein
MVVKNYEVQIPKVFSYDSVRERRIFILEAFVRFHVKDGSDIWLIYFSSRLCTDTLNKFLLYFKVIDPIRLEYKQYCSWSYKNLLSAYQAIYFVPLGLYRKKSHERSLAEHWLGESKAPCCGFVGVLGMINGYKILMLYNMRARARARVCVCVCVCVYS